MAYLTLAECNLREQWQTTVLSVKRGMEEFVMPRGSLVLMPGDELVLLTDKDQSAHVREQFKAPRTRGGRHRIVRDVINVTLFANRAMDPDTPLRDDMSIIVSPGAVSAGPGPKKPNAAGCRRRRGDGGGRADARKRGPLFRCATGCRSAGDPFLKIMHAADKLEPGQALVIVTRVSAPASLQGVGAQATHLHGQAP